MECNLDLCICGHSLEDHDTWTGHCLHVDWPDSACIECECEKYMLEWDLLTEDQRKTLEAFIIKHNARLRRIYKSATHVYVDLHRDDGTNTWTERRYYRPSETYTHYSMRDVHVKARWKLVG